MVLTFLLMFSLLLLLMGAQSGAPIWVSVSTSIHRQMKVLRLFPTFPSIRFSITRFMLRSLTCLDLSFILDMVVDMGLFAIFYLPASNYASTITLRKGNRRILIGRSQAHADKNMKDWVGGECMGSLLKEVTRIWVGIWGSGRNLV